MIKIDSASPIPLYLQIVEQLRSRIALGELRPGDRVPTIRDLASAGGVNRNTAARAIQHLEAEGTVRTRVGQGTFVQQTVQVDRARRDESMDRAIDRLLVEAHSLGVPLEELGWRLSRRIEEFLSRRRS